MIDTHCHLLPGIDDGATTVAESLALARQLAEGGVRTVVCTPHFSRRHPTDHAEAERRRRVIQAELRRAGVPLDLELAAEIGSAAAVEAPLEQLAERRLGAAHLLVELEPDTPAALVEVALERLGEIGLTPVFAHPERCRAVRAQPHVLDAARAEGARVQIVATSLRGRWGEEVARAAWRLVESERADLLASDAHGPRRRGSHLAGAAELVAARCGRAVLDRLTSSGPAEILGVGAAVP